MGKISDIWVRLGLKKQEFDKGMDDAAKKTEKTGGKMSKMLSAAKAGWAAVGAAVIAFGNQMIQATNKVGDAWGHTMSSIKGAWQSILADISNYKPDFSSIGNFFKNEWRWVKKTFGNAKEAGDAAREMSEAFDAEFELTNSLKIQRAKISGELADLQVEMRNTALSPEARMAAVARYRALLEPLYEAEIEQRRKMLDAAVKAWMAGSGVTASTAEVVDFFTRYGTDAEGAAAAHPELQRIYETRKGDKANQPIFDAILALTQAENGLAVELKMVNRTAAIVEKLMADRRIDESELLHLGQEMMDEYSDDLDLGDMDFSDIKVVPPDFSAVDATIENAVQGMEAFRNKLADEAQQIATYNDMISQSIVSAMGNGLQAIMDMIAGVEGADMKHVLAAFIAPLGDTMKQIGAMIMAEGVAMEAFKKSFSNPYAAIAAGAALVAIGSLVSAGIQRLTANPVGGGSGTSYSGGGSYGSYELTNYNSTLTVEVVGRVSGSDIILAGNNQQNKWNR
jgi:hypothetical protein